MNIFLTIAGNLKCDYDFCALCKDSEMLSEVKMFLILLDSIELFFFKVT